MKLKVYLAEAYRYGAMGSLGNATYMLLRQWNFPNEYEQGKDIHVAADSDRLVSWNYKRTQECFEKHTLTRELGFEQWLEKASEEQVMSFLKDFLEADTKVQWTGFRVLGTVHRGNGYPVYTMELFAKHPSTKTEVYTGREAPNVKAPEHEEVNWLGRVR